MQSLFLDLNYLSVSGPKSEKKKNWGGNREIISVCKVQIVLILANTLHEN